MDFEKIVAAIDDDEMDADDVAEVAESVGAVYVEEGSKKQHIEYEPDEVKTGLVASVPDCVRYDQATAVLRELARDETEQGQAELAESYAREE